MTISSDIDSPLYRQIIAWDNLWSAWRKASHGKRGHGPAAAFEFNLADNLLQLQQELSDRTYHPGDYVHFYIHKPKRRKISAAPFRDRVVHHALCNLIEPLFDARFHSHSYANRVGHGIHRAVDQLQAYARRYRYVLRCDVVKHFPSLDHHILRNELHAVINDEGTMWLVDRILESGQGILADEYEMVFFPGDDLFAANRPRGLPIGNLTSQFWSNVYLNPFDWFVTRELGCKAYLRYVDDVAMFGDSKAELYQWRQAIIKRLARYRLTIHETRAQVSPVEQGIPWLGFVVYPTHRLLKRQNVINFRRRLKSRWIACADGEIDFDELDATVQGWINHVRYADTWGLRRTVL